MRANVDDLDSLRHLGRSVDPSSCSLRPISAHTTLEEFRREISGHSIGGIVCGSREEDEGAEIDQSNGWGDRRTLSRPSLIKSLWRDPCSKCEKSSKNTVRATCSSRRKSKNGAEPGDCGGTLTGPMRDEACLFDETMDCLLLGDARVIKPKGSRGVDACLGPDENGKWSALVMESLPKPSTVIRHQPTSLGFEQQRPACKGTASARFTSTQEIMALVNRPVSKRKTPSCGVHGGCPDGKKTSRPTVESALAQRRKVQSECKGGSQKIMIAPQDQPRGTLSLKPHFDLNVFMTPGELPDRGVTQVQAYSGRIPDEIDAPTNLKPADESFKQWLMERKRRWKAERALRVVRLCCEVC